MEVITKTYDSVIIGGGTSGISCAYEMGNDCSVLVIENQLSLGGTQVNGLVTPMMPSFTKHHSFNRDLVQNLTKYAKKTLNDGKNLQTIWFNPQHLQTVIIEMLEKRNVDILFNAQVYEAVLENNEIVALKVISFNQMLIIKAKTFVDASGDAWLARLCNLKTSIAPKNEHSSISYRFEIANVDVKVLKNWAKQKNYKFYDCDDSCEFFEFVHVRNNKSIGEVSEVFEKGLKENKLFESDINYIQGFTIPSKKGCMSFNNPQMEHKYCPTNIDDLNKCVILGQQAQDRLWKFLQENIPGFENSYISMRANMLGIRESYRIIGKYVMNEDDYLNKQKFSDGIARGDWYIDVHSDNEEQQVEKYQKGEYYEIPYRCLVTNELNNYICIGRHISTSFLMQASTRIQVTCQDMGQAAALACVYSLKNKIALNKIDGSIIKEKLEA